ncbi:MAG: two-component system, NarL family, sensor kinase, partial [Bacteroidota bacterium]|nr:two-component system, NarL family, sensor kinase [Bacteroidota bacterium]
MLALRNFLTLFLILLFCIPVIGQKKIFTEKELLQLYNQATTNLHNEDYEKSLIQSRLLLNHSLLLQNHNLIGKAYNTIAANFDGISEPDKALFYYQKSLIYAEKSNDLELQNWLYNNIGNIYCFDKKKYEKGISYYVKSLYFSRSIKDSSQVFLTKLNIAWAYFDIGRFSEGYPYLKYINKQKHKYGIETTAAVTDMLNGMYYSYTKENQKADYSFKKGIKNAIKYDEKTDLSFLYQEYSKFLSKNKKFEAAYENLNAFQKLTDEINLKDNAKKAKIAGINLEIDEYKREIDKMGIESKKREKLFNSE